MIMGFKGEFVPKVVDGSKPHSFRKGKRWKVGDTIHFYEKVRTKDMRKIRPDAVVVSVQNVIMYVDCIYNIEISGRRINTFLGEELKKIYKADGFKDDGCFWNFFFPKAKAGQSWEGQLVHWTDLKY